MEVCYGGFLKINFTFNRIKKFNGDFESILRCEIEYVSQPDKPWVKPPI
jgi:AP-2 complex subunit mu-1